MSGAPCVQPSGVPLCDVTVADGSAAVTLSGWSVACGSKSAVGGTLISGSPCVSALNGSDMAASGQGEEECSNGELADKDQSTRGANVSDRCHYPLHSCAVQTLRVFLDWHV